VQSTSLRAIWSRYEQLHEAGVTQRIILGHITGAHGIKGDLVVRTYTEVPEDLGAYGPLADGDGKGAFVVQSVRSTPKGAIIRIKGVGDRTAAERLKGVALTVARAALPDAADGQYYHADLIGMSAITPDGAMIGTVVAIQNFGAGDLLELQLTGQRDTALLPFTDPVVPHVDIAARRLTVVMPVMVDDKEDEDGADAGSGSGSASAVPSKDGKA
jgi:16S rRNA processing protein RimM